MLISTIVFLFFLFATYALFLITSRKSDERHARLQKRVAEALQESSSLSIDEAIQITREDSISSNPTINRLLSPLDIIKKLDTIISQADMRITVSRLLMFCLLAATMGGLATYTVMNAPFALAVAFLAGVIPLLQVGVRRSKRLRRFNEQLPDTLDLLSRSLSVGHAFSESLNQ